MWWLDQFENGNVKKATIATEWKKKKLYINCSMENVGEAAFNLNIKIKWE